VDLVTGYDHDDNTCRRSPVFHKCNEGMPGGCVRRWFRPVGLFQQAADNARCQACCKRNNENPSGSFKEVIRQAMRPQDTGSYDKSSQYSRE
jgi:hypothetical protein